MYASMDGQGRGSRQIAVYGPDAEANLVLIGDLVPLGDDADFDEWECEGLRVRQPEALQTAEVLFESEQISLEYTFTGRHRPFSYRENPDGCPQWLATNRFEQAGSASGTVRVGDREIAFEDAPAHRDHSWGRRRWSWVHHWKWIMASVPGGADINAMLHVARGEIGINGFVVRDGQPVALGDVHSRATYGDDMALETLDLELVDVNGDDTAVRLERYAMFWLPFGADGLNAEHACHAWIDGKPGVGQVETLWPRGYLERLRTKT